MAKYENIADEIEAMLNGRHESEEYEENSGSEEYDEFNEESDFEDDSSNQDGLDEDELNNNSDEDNDNSENDENSEGSEDDSNEEDSDENSEDTSGQDEENENDENDSETNDENDGSSNDTDENNSDENDESDDGNTQEEDGDDSEDNSDDTNDKNDGSNQDTTDIDPAEFAKLKSFYEKVTGEFKANGKTIKGFNDPEKIVQGLQKAIGFEEKNAIINKHKKFLAPLKEKGFLDNPDKFNLAMSIMDGDPEAIKKHLKALEINPVLDLDLEEIKYMPKQHIASDGKVILDEAFETADTYGIKDKLSEVLGSEFDDDSFQDFIKYPKLRNDLIEHIQDGTYDLVKSKIDEIRLTDIGGEFKSAKTVDQYRFALELLGKEYSENKTTNVEQDNSSNNNANINTNTVTKTDDKSNKAVIKNTADNIMSQAVVLDDKRRAEILAEEEEKFRAETAAKLAADKARKEAASVSKTKTAPKSSEKKQEFDPLKLEGDDFRKYFNTLMG